jgi:hypothetical protein
MMNFTVCGEPGGIVRLFLSKKTIPLSGFVLRWEGEGRGTGQGTCYAHVSLGAQSSCCVSSSGSVGSDIGKERGRGGG